MTSNLLLHDKLYQETAFIILSFFTLLGVVLFFLRNKSAFFMFGWASVKSWAFLAPMTFILLGFPHPWPLVSVTGLSILGAKIFFQIVGIFHRSHFVWIVYFGILGLAFNMQSTQAELFNLLPMLVLGILCLVPLWQNNYKNMIQYISLSLVGFVLLGWSLMHLGKILLWPQGIFIFIYLVILTEFCDNVYLSWSTLFRRGRLFDKISNRRTIGGFLVAILLTTLLAWGLRHIMPSPEPKIWILSAAIAACAGSLGDLVLSVIRRDLGIKNVDGFILGRGDILDRLDRLIFVAPIYYHVMNPYLA